MQTFVKTAATGAALALALFGCNKQDPATGSQTGAQTGAQTAAPASQKAPAPAPVQQAKVQGAAAAAPGSMPVNPHAGAGKLPPGHPPAGGMPPGHPPAGGMPPGHPPAGGPAMPAPGAGGTLTGKIELDAGMKAKVKAGSVLFIIVRQDAGEGQRGMLLAAKKVPVTGADMFPLNYTVGPQDIMMQGTQLAGNVRLEARVDQDGDAISKAPGDVVGALGKAVKVGDKDLNFVLNQSL